MLDIHRFLTNAQCLALLPRFSHPRMNIRVKHPVCCKLLIISFEFAPAPMLSDHVFSSYVIPLGILFCKLSYLPFYQALCRPANIFVKKFTLSLKTAVSFTVNTSRQPGTPAAVLVNNCCYGIIEKYAIYIISQ